MEHLNGPVVKIIELEEKEDDSKDDGHNLQCLSAAFIPLAC